MKKIKKTLLVILTLALVVSSFAVTASADCIIDPVEDENAVHYRGIQYCSVDLKDPFQLVNVCDDVFTGAVTGISFEVFYSQTGKAVKETGLPDTGDQLDYGDSGNNYIISTVYEIEVSKSYKGKASGKVELRFWGGLEEIMEDEQLAAIKKCGFENKNNIIHIVIADEKVNYIEQGKEYIFFAFENDDGDMLSLHIEYYAFGKDFIPTDNSRKYQKVNYDTLEEYLETVYYKAYSNDGGAIAGDANGDGTVDSADATVILRYDAGLIELDESKLASADFNGDGSVDSADARSILKADTGLLYC